MYEAMKLLCVCGFRCDSESHLMRHRLEQHNKNIITLPSLYKCNLCNKQFQARKFLRTHLQGHDKLDVYAAGAIVPISKRNQRCKICFEEVKTCDKQQHMTKHLPSIGLVLVDASNTTTKMNAFKCINCGLSFLKPAIFRKHMEIHKPRPNMAQQRNMSMSDERKKLVKKINNLRYK